MLAQKVMYEKFGNDFLIQFAYKCLNSAHCPPESTEQYFQKLQVKSLCIPILFLSGT